MLFPLPRSGRLLPVLAVLATCAALRAPSDVVAQEISARSLDLRIGGRLQPQYQASSVDDAASDIFLRRARVRVDASWTDFVDGRIGVDVGGVAPA